MKKIAKSFIFVLLITLTLTFAGCDLLEGLFGGGDDDGVEKINDELTSITGKWSLVDDEDTYFTFDGTKGAMTIAYVENGLSKYNGTFRVVFHGENMEVLTPLSFIITRTDKTKEDWVGCYVEGFKTDFTQFTIMTEEEDLGMIDASIYTHIYRISELPYKMGTYVLEGKELKQESNIYASADEDYIPSGTYTLPTGESFTFLMTKPTVSELFTYRNGDVVVEGTFTMAGDKKTIYLYIEHDPYSKVTPADKEFYDTTFDIYYPPDFYLRGDFSKDGYIVINDLYRHGETPSLVKDSDWVFGTYSK